VGVLAALAVYGVRKYLLNAKTAEARNSIGQMAKDAKAAFERESMDSTILNPSASAGLSNNLCTSASNPVPKNMSSVKGAKYQSAVADWSEDQATQGKGFACLRFSMSDPQYYRYTYTGTAGAAGTFTVLAEGDLNGDGATFSAFSMDGKVDNGVVLVSPNIKEVNPEE
jgi:type IV pilus assembly protein PilA